ncbi:MAG: hypothetical protein R6U89_04545 [Dehalococcoidia bacterium]
MQSELVNRKFREWSVGKTAIEARIKIFESIRDIPYAVIPELVSHETYADILRYWKGSCTPKHFLMAGMYERLGMTVLYSVFPFNWADLEIDMPERLRSLAMKLPLSHHLACRAEVNGDFVLIDATVDPPLERLGLPVNKEWDGVSNTSLPIKPAGEEQVFHPVEAATMSAPEGEDRLAFYEELNLWLDQVRSSWK